MREHQHLERAPDAGVAEAGKPASRARQRPGAVPRRPVDATAIEQERPGVGLRAVELNAPASTRVQRSTARVPSFAVSSDRTPKIRRIAVKFVDGVDADKPSTYDTGGGHSYKDHGSQTTKEQHMTRLRTGVAPSGRVSRVPPGKASSKFKSDPDIAAGSRGRLGGSGLGRV